MIEDLIDIREGEKKERNLILSSWLKSLRRYSNYHAAIAAHIYFRVHAQAIEHTLNISQVVVATPKSDENIAIAYLVYEPRDGYLILHYAYTKKSFRKMGIQHSLIESIKNEEDLFCSHITSFVKLKGIKFNPYFFKTEYL